MKPMPSRAAISFSAPAMSNACARLSSAHGPAISANGSLLPKRTLPTVTIGLGLVVISVLAGDHHRRAASGQPPRQLLFHSGKCGRLEYLVHRISEDRTILLARGACIDPVRIGHESVPFLLAVGERLPGQQIGQLEVGLADQRGPEASLLDAVLVPKLERDVLKPLQQSRQPARHT